MRTSRGEKAENNRVDQAFLQDVLEESKEMQEELKMPRDLRESREVNETDSSTQKSQHQSKLSLQESVRDTVFSVVKDLFHTPEVNFEEEEQIKRRAEKRRKELRSFLENLADVIQGKSANEAAAEFSSMLNIATQLSLQKSDSVITARCRLGEFLRGVGREGVTAKEMRQEVSLLFSPEEIEAIRARLETIDENDPLRPFFTTILDQAFDTGQYNEITGTILVEMTKYFLEKLESHGYDTHAQVVDFKSRHDRTMQSLAKAIEELRDTQQVIDGHVKKHPVLVEFPRALRLLIQVRLGLVPQTKVPELLNVIRNQQAEYTRVRNLVGVDFNRLPALQHEVHLRQSSILSLHKNVLHFTATEFEAEYARIKDEFENLTSEIEAAAEKVDPNSPEYKEMIRKKELLQKKIAEQRRHLDVLKSQQKFVEIQHNQVQACLEHLKELDASLADIKQQAKIDPNKIREVQSGESKKKQSRMATVTLRETRQS